MTLHERIQLLVSIFLIVLAVTAIIDAVAVGQRDKILDRASLYETAREHADQLLTAYVDQETAVRGYVISRDRSYLEPYEAGQVDAERALTELRRTLPQNDGTGLMELVDRIEAAAQQWQEESAEREIEATDAGRSDEAAALVASGRGQELFDALRTQVANLRHGIRQQQQAAEHAAGRARRLINLMMAVSFGSGVLLLLVISGALRRWSTRPLHEITTAMREVTDGDLERRIPAVGPRDIAELGEDAELMRRRIVAELDSARRAEQALRSRGAIVSVLRQELGPTGDSLPPSLATDAGFEPVKGVLAGDWYDVLAIDDGSVALCLIDVSGHGQSTGVFALQAKNLMLAGVRQGLDPGEVLAWMARALGDTGDDFLTCFLAKIDPESGVCRYASAGHVPTLLTRDGAVTELGPTGPLLGPLPGEWSTETVMLEPASLLVAYTDGVTEARGPGDEEFGEERLKAVVAARAGEHPTSVIGTCLDAVHDFARGDPSDDLTIVAMRWLPRDQPNGT